MRGPTTTGTAVGTGRVVALDLLRFAAIVGMVASHLLGPGHHPEWVLVVVSGFPSTTFAVVSGISAVLATQRWSAQGHHLAAGLSLATRGVVVAVIGVLLDRTQTGVIVVLVYLGAALILAAPLLRLPVRALLAVAAVIGLGGPYLNLAVRAAMHHPSSYEIDTSSPLAATASVLFTGTYPVITWIVYVLVGMAVGKALGAAAQSGELGAFGRRLSLYGGGAALLAVIADLVSRPTIVRELAADPRYDRAYARLIAVADSDGAPIGSGWRVLVNAAPHSGSVGDVLRTGGTALLLLGLLLLLTRRRPGHVPLVLRPVQAAGAAPLTIYTAHVLATAYATGHALAMMDPTMGTPDQVWWLGGPGIIAVHVAALLVIGLVLAMLGRRGPLETLTSGFAGAVAWVAGRPRSARLPTDEPAA